MAHLLTGLKWNLQAYFKTPLNKYNHKLLINNTDDFIRKNFYKKFLYNANIKIKYT